MSSKSSSKDLLGRVFGAVSAAWEFIKPEPVISSNRSAPKGPPPSPPKPTR